MAFHTKINTKYLKNGSWNLFEREMFAKIVFLNHKIRKFCNNLILRVTSILFFLFICQFRIRYFLCNTQFFNCYVLIVVVRIEICNGFERFTVTVTMTNVTHRHYVIFYYRSPKLESLEKDSSPNTFLSHHLSPFFPDPSWFTHQIFT